MSVKLLTEHHLEILSLKEGFTGSSESTLVKMPWVGRSRGLIRANTESVGVFLVIRHILAVILICFMNGDEMEWLPVINSLSTSVVC